MVLSWRNRLPRDVVVAVGIGIWATLWALVPGIFTKAVLIAPLVAIAALWWVVGRSDRWLTTFFAFAMLLPPLPIALGNSGPHLAALLPIVGGIVTLALPARTKLAHRRLLLYLLMFLIALLQSLIFAALFSGVEVALQSLLRITLFAIGPLILVYTLKRPRPLGDEPIRLTRLLFRFAIAAVLFACIDFYFQLPSPVPHSEQYVWLTSGIIRRAQGLFYEASTFGNFCAFFLVFALVAFFSPAETRPCSRLELGFGAALLAFSIVLSYSRGSLVNVIVAGIMFVALRKRAGRRMLLAGVGTAVLIVTVIYFIFPEFWRLYWIRLEGSVLHWDSSPEAILSGRLSSWSVLIDFLKDHPWHMILGIGYKTIPYSAYIASDLIADNTYLALLIETGIFGLICFIAWSFEALRSAFRAARSSLALPRFFGAWFFCFWMGELAQMMSGDLITYWRVLPLCFWTLGMALVTSEAQLSRRLPPSDSR